MKTFEEIRMEILAEGLDDYVGLWEVAWMLRRSMSEATSAEIRESALAVLRPLLTARLIEPGALEEGGGFRAWGCSAQEALARISREWSTLSHDPNIGQICWFSNTTAGDVVAEGGQE